MANYMGYLPAHIRYNKSLTPEEKLLYAELTAMVGANGRCRFDLGHLKDVFTHNSNSIKQMLNTLYKAGAVNKEGEHIVLDGQVVTDRVELKVDTSFIDEVIELWNTLFKKDLPLGIRRTAKLTKLLTERQASFTNEEILTALQNRHDFVSRSDWHNLSENRNAKISIFITLGSDDKLEEALNLKANNVKDMKRSTIAVKKENVNKNLLE